MHRAPKHHSHSLIRTHAHTHTVIARLPNIGFAPSMLTEKGFESRGSFTVRKSRAGESFYLRIYGKLNHNLRSVWRWR